MIGYLCKYTPIELFYGFGEDPWPIDPAPAAQQEAGMHPNLCSFAKAAYSHFTASGASRAVFTNCCDSIKRMYDILEEQTEFHTMLSLPRVYTPESVRLYAAQLLQFIKDYETFSGKPFDANAFLHAIRSQTRRRTKNGLYCRSGRAHAGRAAASRPILLHSSHCG